MTLIKNPYFKTISFIAVLTVISLIGFGVAYGYGGGGGGPAPTPTVINSVNVPLNILPTQSGNITKNFGQQGTVSVDIPTGAVNSLTTFQLQQSAANANERPSNTQGAFMIGDKIFHITAEDSNNKPVRDFNSNLTVSIIIPEMPGNITDLGVYYFNETTNKWVLVPGAIFNPTTGKVTFTINHLTKFSVLKIAGLPTSVDAGKKESTPAPEVITTPKPKNVPKVLGVKEYPDGSLLRGIDKKIYIIIDGARKLILNLKELFKYQGQKINDVANEILSQYPIVLGFKTTPIATLVRTPDKKIFVVNNGIRVHIKTLQQLRSQYRGIPITDVSN